jgi:8-amino-3,8-dideoxy-alpha-D-manno-octulosonate transaminase
MNLDLFGGFPGARLIGEEELAEVTEVIRARSPYRFYGTDLRRKVEALENALSQYTSREHVLCVSSGTAALHTALAALGIGQGDEVIVPAYGWSADIMAVLAVGAIPVIAPIDGQLGIDAARLADCFTDQTRAVIAVHMRGFPCDVSRVLAVAKDHGFAVIEDGTQCMGGMIDQRPVGALGDVSVFSFQYNKLITGGEGGAMLCNDGAIAERARAFHDLGMVREVGSPDPEGEGAIAGFGLNYRMSELSAAMVLAQLDKVPRILKRLFEVREKAFNELSWVLDEHALVERSSVPGTAQNNAFLCLQAPDTVRCRTMVEALSSLDLPVQYCGRRDPHHFETWTAFMKRDGYDHRCLAGLESVDILDRNLFLEIRPL